MAKDMEMAQMVMHEVRFNHETFIKLELIVIAIPCLQPVLIPLLMIVAFQA